MGVPEDESNGKQHGLVTAPKIQDNKSGKNSNSDEEPPEIPPRMKKKGPELPEKPAHLRLASLTKINPSTSMLNSSSHSDFSKSVLGSNASYNNNNSGNNFNVAQKSRQPSTDQKLFLENARRKSAGTDREILVAATKNGARERQPPEKRQREPAKLLTNTFKVPDDDTQSEIMPNDTLPILLGLASPKPHRRSTGNPNKPVSFKTNSSNKVSTRNATRQPVLLVPRSHLDSRNLQHQQFWSSYPVSYGVWVQNSGSGEPQLTSRMVRKAYGPSAVELRPAAILVSSKGHNKKSSPTNGHNQQLETKIFVSGKNSKHHGSGEKPRSSSVTRSGSLTSHDSTSSDSGNEMIPKSVLKKHRREQTPTSISNNNSNNAKKNNEHKKNVTFNAFATVQLMEE